MDNLTEQQIERLQQAVQQGAIVRDWCKHPGFKIFEDFIKAKIEDKKNDWLRADDKGAEKIRQQASVWISLLDEIKKFMMSGDNASRVIREYQEAASENFSNNQPPQG